MWEEMKRIQRQCKFQAFKDKFNYLICTISSCTLLWKDTTLSAFPLLLPLESKADQSLEAAFHILTSHEEGQSLMLKQKVLLPVFQWHPQFRLPSHLTECTLSLSYSWDELWANVKAMAAQAFPSGTLTQTWKPSPQQNLNLKLA